MVQDFWAQFGPTASGRVTDLDQEIPLPDPVPFELFDAPPTLRGWRYDEPDGLVVRVSRWGISVDWDSSLTELGVGYPGFDRALMPMMEKVVSAVSSIFDLESCKIRAARMVYTNEWPAGNEHFSKWCTAPEIPFTGPANSLKEFRLTTFGQLYGSNVGIWVRQENETEERTCLLTTFGTVNYAEPASIPEAIEGIKLLHADLNKRFPSQLTEAAKAEWEYERAR